VWRAAEFVFPIVNLDGSGISLLVGLLLNICGSGVGCLCSRRQSSLGHGRDGPKALG
jgi:hypothetical protein